MEPVAYAVKHKDEEIRSKSRSGGIFTAISDAVLDSGGTVYGCIMTKDFRVLHVRADDKETRNKMRGSKYVQSSLGNTFKEVKEDLENNLNVLFSGTSCQIAGLRAYLNKEYKNLICVDIVCHGVPSPLIFKKYIEFQENNYKGKCVGFDFRNKDKFGWAEHIETLFIKKDDKITEIDSRLFTELFYSHNILRPSCYKCPYKSIYHPGDITIADFWGIDKAVPGFNDNKGVSLVLINNPKGIELFNSIKLELMYHECKIEQCLQPPLVKAYPPPKTRRMFWYDFYILPFRIVVKKYAVIIAELKNKKNKIIKFIKRLLHRVK